MCTNPGLLLLDLSAVVEAVRSRAGPACVIAVDNTFLTPWVSIAAPDKRSSMLSSTCAGGASSGLRRGPGDALLHQVRRSSCRQVQLLLTRYINGHSDVILGALLINSPDLYKKMFAVQVSS